jgi:hypothetical protein
MRGFDVAGITIGTGSVVFTALYFAHGIAG